MVFLLLLTACGQRIPSPTPSLSPTERSAPSPTLAPAMDTPMPSPTTKPLTATSTQSPTTSIANADVIFVRTIQSADESWVFQVTVSHPDTGWEDYADGWDILLPNGSKLTVNASDPFTRLLVHPHVDEQPFTRNQRGIIIPENVTQVIVRAHDLVDGWGGQEITVDLNQASGEGFEVNKLSE